MHKHTQTCTCKHADTYGHTCKHVLTHMQTNQHINSCTHMHTNACMHLHMYTHAQPYKQDTHAQDTHTHGNVHVYTQIVHSLCGI